LKPTVKWSLALLFVGAFAAFAYDRLILAPERQEVIRRYNEFRGVVATGDANLIMKYIAPEFRDWNATRLHVYPTFARPLAQSSTVSVFLGEATICPKPERKFFLIPGGHVIKMVKHDGQWFVRRVYID
jgi:hypothetical protein